MYRTLVLTRHTFVEAVVQPIYTLLVGLGLAILVIFTFLPFFTLGEDAVMFKAVSLDVILLLVLIATLFATSRSVYEEIEDRTMLTLMSKPVHRWQVLFGKYLGIILAALMAIVILGSVLALATWWRVPADYSLALNSLDDRETQRLIDYRRMHLLSLVPSLAQVWFSISTLAAVGIAISTRMSLVVNLPVVILIYLAGNLTRFIFPLTGPEAPLADQPVVVRSLAYVFGVLMPYLEAFDLRALVIHSPLAIGHFAANPNAVQLSTIWSYLAISAGYAATYAFFALCVGMWLFQTRDLGGGEG